jgi:hypothetical protein
MGERPERTPIYSTRADDPQLAETLDGFVVGLMERIDRLQDTCALDDLKDLAALANALVVEAGSLGYATLATGAAAVETAGRAGNPAAARDALVTLTDIAQRVLLGHRGAM